MTSNKILTKHPLGKSVKNIDRNRGDHHDHKRTEKLRGKTNRGAFSAFDEDQRQITARKSGGSLERSDYHWMRREGLDFRRAARREVHAPGRGYRYDFCRASKFVCAAMHRYRGCFREIVPLRYSCS